jgi:hypothetical protein
MTAVLTPEASTLAMLMLGFGGLGLAAFFVGMNIRTGLCSYCSAPIPESDMPLVMWIAAGYSIRFCIKCQHDWWTS